MIPLFRPTLQPGRYTKGPDAMTAHWRAGELSGVAAIFDLDGTLVDSAPDIGASLNFTLAAEGLEPFDLVGVKALIGHGGEAMVRDAFARRALAPADKCEDVDARRFRRFLDHYEANLVVATRPYADAVAFLDALRAAGARLAICTNKRERLARRLLSALGLSDLFAIIVGRETAGAPKPDPAPVRMCLSALDADRAIFFGDSDTDIAAAAAAGVPCFLHFGGYGPFSMVARAVGGFDAFRDAHRCFGSAAADASRVTRR